MEQATALTSRDAAIHDRDISSVSRRMADRLAAASARHRGVLEQLRSDQERRRAALEAETSAAEGTLAAEVAQSERDLDAANVGALRQLQAADDHDERRRQSAQRHAEERAEIDRGHDVATRELLDASARADRAIAASKSEAASRLAALADERADMAAKLQEDLQRRTEAQARHLEEAVLQGDARMQKAAKYKKTSALTREHMEELSQAGRSIAQKKAALTREKASQQVAEMARQAHEAQVHTDRSVKEHLEGSARQLIAAREHCEQVREEMAQEAAEYAQRIRALEEQHWAGRDALDEEVRALEGSRVEAFRCSCQETTAAEERFRARRAASEAELDAVERRLREIEAETRRRAEQILAQWTEGNAATEAAVRRLEQEAETALRDLAKSADDNTQAAAEHNGALQASGAEAVSELSRRGIQVQEATQPALEAAREADERAAFEAQRTTAELRPEPERLAAEADAEAEEAQRRAVEEERVLEAEGERAQVLAREAARQAREEEARLKAETAEAWAKVRKACFQLRLGNLHDFAAGILEGTFDLPAPALAVG